MGYGSSGSGSCRCGLCLAGGQLGVGLDGTLVSLVADRVGVQMRVRIQSRDKQSSQSVQSMQAMYPEGGFRYGIQKPANDGHEAQLPGLLDQTGD